MNEKDKQDKDKLLAHLSKIEKEGNFVRLEDVDEEYKQIKKEIKKQK